MGTIRFSAPERPKLLAAAVLAHFNEDGHESDLVDHDLVDLADALLESNGKLFDELLTEHYRAVALGSIGAGAPPAERVETYDRARREKGEVGVDPETGGEAKVEK